MPWAVPLTQETRQRRYAPELQPEASIIYPNRKKEGKSPLVADVTFIPRTGHAPTVRSCLVARKTGVHSGMRGL